MGIVFVSPSGLATRKRSNVPHNNKRPGRGMKTIAGLGKLLATLFWCVVLANLIDPYAQPFAQLLMLAGVAVLALHAAEMLLFNRLLSAQPSVGVARMNVLAFGMFHLWALPAVEHTSQPVSLEETAHA
jgi:putative membrane protein